MTCRPAPLNRTQQAELGGLVLALKQSGASWKELQAQFAMERTQLWRCVRRYLAAQIKAEAS